METIAPVVGPYVSTSSALFSAFTSGTAAATRMASSTK